MQLFRLANVLIKQDDFTIQRPELYFRAQSSLAFNEAEQSLSLKGSAFIKTASGEELMRLKGQKNEKLVPIERLNPSLREALEIDYHFLGAEDDRSLFLKLLELAPHNKHVLPESLLKAKPEAVYYSRGAYPGIKTMRCKVLVALDATGENAHVRIMDKARYQRLCCRYKQLTHEYAHGKEALAQEYRAASPYLTSRAFRQQYPGLQ